jgi:hypothetical protein
MEELYANVTPDLKTDIDRRRKKNTVNKEYIMSSRLVESMVDASEEGARARIEQEEKIALARVLEARQRVEEETRRRAQAEERARKRAEARASRERLAVYD